MCLGLSQSCHLLLLQHRAPANPPGSWRACLGVQAQFTPCVAARHDNLTLGRPACASGGLPVLCGGFAEQHIRLTFQAQSSSLSC